MSKVNRVRKVSIDIWEQRKEAVAMAVHLSGTSDRLELFKQGDRLALINTNSRMPYIGIRIIEPNGSWDNSFFQNDDDFEAFTDIEGFKRCKSLSDVCDGNLARIAKYFLEQL